MGHHLSENKQKIQTLGVRVARTGDAAKVTRARPQRSFYVAGPALDPPANGATADKAASCLDGPLLCSQLIFFMWNIFT
jgi:hypothetical protein